jgi:hypothetical protein
MELLGQEARLDGTGSAEGHEGEVAGVEAVTGQHVRERRVHVGGGDLDHRFGGGVDVEAEGLAQRAQRRDRSVRVQSQPATDEVLGVQESTHQKSVGQGRLAAAAAVAGRPGFGARAPRPDLRQAQRTDAGDGAAARADLDHLYNRDLDR